MMEDFDFTQPEKYKDLEIKRLRSRLEEAEELLHQAVPHLYTRRQLTERIQAFLAGKEKT